MASITYDNAKRYRHLGQDEEAPEQNQSEILRQRIVRELLEKQLSKHTSLEKQLHNQKQFVKAACEESVTGSTSGLASFEKFKSVESLLHVKQTLKSCGLADAEIQLLLDEESHSSPLEAPHARKQRLQAIEEKLAYYSSHLEASVQAPEEVPIDDSLASHQKEVTEVPVPGEIRQPTRCQDFFPDAHPMNHLKELAEELFPTQNPNQRCSGENTGRKRQHYKILGPAKPKRDKKELQCIYLTEKPKSYWDMQQIPKVVENKTTKLSAPFPLPPEKCLVVNTSNRDKVLHVTKKNHVRVDQTKPFIMSLATEDLIPLATIEANRKSIQELKDMEKFKNYNKGTPSHTLYIKNLSPSVTPRDLAALMGHFESSHGPKILYRILGGRMKGQAFVTFSDEGTACTALEMCNGYVLRGRPLVAVFGKRT